MDAQIFSIGTEILLGNITDTNSRYIAEQLMGFGINVYKMVTVGDNKQRLIKAFADADGKVDYVIASGGLGPTGDDISKESLVEYLGLNDELTVHDPSYQKLLDYFKDDFKTRGNIKQAMFPSSAEVLENPIGTAPGMMAISKKGTKFFLMPGPPNEMKEMFDNQVSKHLTKDSYMKSVFAKVALLGEWDMARRVDLDRTSPTISPYITDEGPVLRITAKAPSEMEALKQIDLGKKIVNESLSSYIITTDDLRKEEVLINILRDNKEFVACAESVTGGLIASSIIDIPGASDVIKESYICYADETKEKILNVSRETIKEYTVVSKEVLVQMLDGLRKTSGADLCIATTGLAHTGEIYLGISYHGRTYINHRTYKGDRNRVRLRCKNTAMDMAILIMRGDYEDNFSV